MFAVLLPYIFWVIAIFRQQSRYLVEPSGIHMAYTEHQHELSFVWSSILPQWGSRLHLTPLVCQDPTDLTVPLSITADWQWSFIRYSRTWEVVYTAVVAGVAPTCRYRYEVGAGITWVHPREFSVRTPYYSSPSPSDLSRSSSFLVIGDMGSGPISLPTRSRLLESLSSPFDAVFHLGDIAYDLESIRPAISRAYFAEIEPFASIVPYMVLPGNHEIIDNYAQYKADFRMPVNDENGGSNLFYSFNHGRAHFTVICGEDLYHSDPEVKQAQLHWIQTDLNTANSHREETPWLIVMTHRPFYCLVNYRWRPGEDEVCNLDCGPRAERLRGLLEEMFYQAGVDLVLHAHVHGYQRTTPLYRNNTVLSAYDDLHTHTDPKAPIFILCGASGNREGNDPLSPTTQLWNLVQLRDLSYGRFYIPNATHVYWELRGSLSNDILDYVSISKSQTRYDSNSSLQDS